MNRYCQIDDSSPHLAGGVRVQPAFVTTQPRCTDACHGARYMARLWQQRLAVDSVLIHLFALQADHPMSTLSDSSVCVCAARAALSNAHEDLWAPARVQQLAAVGKGGLI